ncbi:MAG: ABC transporter ATP-binding protein [Proteobacteria bacterium]|nr:MAG: ABC transporter ATP-binding protein [Pseudomonadota bacterium]PIE64701.1 MAG: ABC transporter ATP-binding protein [Desulfobacterales bacterium]
MGGNPTSFDGAVPDIVLKSVSLSYDDQMLFDRLSLVVDGGKCTCILGPSGCGKSTLLKVIADNSSIPYGGSVHFGQIAERTGMIAWMAQNDLLLPWMTVINNVMLGARLRGEKTSGLKARAAALLDKAGLGEYREKLPGVLSGGMRQRVALLRTLMEDRPVLLMDEPFSALDALTRVVLQNMAAEMTRGRTVLLVTHDPLEALRIADKIIVFSDRPARIVAEFGPGGSPPREMDDQIMGRLYPFLLKKLLD